MDKLKERWAKLDLGKEMCRIVFGWLMIMGAVVVFSMAVKIYLATGVYGLVAVVLGSCVSYWIGSKALTD